MNHDIEGDILIYSINLYQVVDPDNPYHVHPIYITEMITTFVCYIGRALSLVNI